MIEEKVHYKAQSGKLYPAKVLERKIIYIGGFKKTSSGFQYLIEITTNNTTQQILCTPDQLRLRDEPYNYGKTIGLEIQPHVKAKKSRIKKI